MARKSKKARPSTAGKKRKAVAKAAVSAKRRKSAVKAKRSAKKAAGKKTPARKTRKAVKKAVRNQPGKRKATAKRKTATAARGAKRAAKARTGKKAAPKKTAPKKAAAKKSTAQKASARKSAAAPAKRALRTPGPTIVRAAPAVRRPPGRPAPRPAKVARGGRLSRPLGATRPRRAAASLVKGVVIRGPSARRYDEILTAEALAFLAALHRKFDARRKALLAARSAEQERYDAGALPDFPAETRHVREGEWKIAPIPRDLADRRVEITGPVDRKMVINALNCGANVFMADFEDANSPTWANNLEGQINLKDRWAGALDYTDPATGRDYALAERPAVLVVRPRGWHLDEVHLTVDGEPVSGALFDFGLYVFHNLRAILAQGTQPYFYLPKLETYREARLWNDVFVHAEEAFRLPLGTIKATVLIETLPAAFQMDEILFELRDHVVGLNAGRWDYIFSFIKKLANNPAYVLPDRGQVVMGKAFLGAYAALLVKTCHRRGAFAMGGMAAQIPVRGDPKANDEAFARVRADKEREVREGHDGTWVAHPDLVPVAKEVFDRLMPQPNQLDRTREDVAVARDDLLRLHEGTRTEEGFRHNIRVGVQYIEAWLRGRGAVPIYNLMEDAATAEISRAQIWQWIRYGVVLDTGVTAAPEFFRRALAEEMERVKAEIGAENYAKGRFPEAIKLFGNLSLAPEFEDFLTIPAYRLIA